VIVCTDHGHYLGERDLWGKPGVPAYAPLGPRAAPRPLARVAPGECGALTTTVDLHATLCDQFRSPLRRRRTAAHCLPLLTGERESVRRHVLGGCGAVMCSW